MGCAVSVSNNPARESKVNVSSSKEEPKQTLSPTNTGISCKQTLPNGVQHSSITPQNDKQSDGYVKSSNESDDIRKKATQFGGEILTILHFNDVYNIEPREKEPVGGAARFAYKLASYKDLNPLTVFSGDVL